MVYVGFGLVTLSRGDYSAGGGGSSGEMLSHACWNHGWNARTQCHAQCFPPTAFPLSRGVLTGDTAVLPARC